MRKRIVSLLCVLALCLLQVTAFATDDWEHIVNEHSDWTALTSDELNDLEYTLPTGKYFLSGDDFGGMPLLMLSQSIVIPSGADVILCLAETYCFPQGDIVPIMVEFGGTLTICDCSDDSSSLNGNYLGSSESAAAIENHGILNIVSGTIGYAYTSPVIDNEAGATLNFSGTPVLTYANGNNINAITSAGTISASYGGIPYTGYTLLIEYTGATGGTVVTGVTDVNKALFKGPGNTDFTYDETSGTLSAGAPVTYGSLIFAGSQTVGDGVYYNITSGTVTDPSMGPYYKAQLSEGSASDYDLLWDEAAKTLTLNDATITASVTSFNGAESLFSLPIGDFTVNLIGKNSITVYSHTEGIKRNAYSFESQNGNIMFQGDGSLAIIMLPGAATTGNIDITGIIASGEVENQAELTISGSPGQLSWQGSISGISCGSFTNNGTVDIGLSNLFEGIGIRVNDGTFTNNGTLNVEFTGTSGCGILVNRGSKFHNSGSIQMDLQAALSSQGIYCNTNQFFWNNAAGGNITIQVSGNGGSVGGVSTGPVAGMNLWTETITLNNSGSLSLTAVRKEASKLTNITWPIGQYFDTIGLVINCDGGTVANTGTMNLTAQNGNAAGLNLISKNADVSIVSSGELWASATTSGGDGIRAVGLYGEIKFIDDAQVKKLSITLSGKADASAAAEEDAQVDPENLMAICMVQSFDNSAPASTDALQQISAGEGYLLPSTPVVLKQGKQNVYINTIAGAENKPAASVHLLKQITGTVTIEGNPLVGCELCANVTNLPDDLVDFTYQWQASDSANGMFEDITDADEQSYTLTSNEAGKYIRVVITPTDNVYGGTLTATTSGTVSYPSATYQILLETASYGVVKASHSRATRGTTVTLTITPEEGYALEKLTVTDANGNAVSVTKSSDTKYTFKMPASKVTVRATFEKAELVSSLPFTDVDVDDWFYEAVEYVYDNGMMNGTSSTVFSPNNNLTRGMIATILYRLEDEPEAGSPTFTDVASDQYYADAIAWAAANGIVTGYDKITFGPDDPITREQLATILYRYASYKGYDVPIGEDTNILSYTDAFDISEYAFSAFQWACGAGVIEGVTESTLVPQGTATRAQVATMLMRFCVNVAKD